MLIRYPGSKDKHFAFLDRHIPDNVKSFADAFCGTAAVTFKLLENRDNIQRVWLNDIDPGIADLWTIVRDEPKRLCGKIERYVPKAKDFYCFKHNMISDPVERAFRKLAIHQISYSGLGAKAGSPIGGREQKGAYKVGCRWNADRLISKVKHIHELMNKCDDVYITNQEWIDVVKDKSYFLYADPPYIGEGSGLYINGEIEHEELAAALNTRKNWLLSYDNHPLVRKLYPNAKIIRIGVTSHLHHKLISDVIVKPKERELTGS